MRLARLGGIALAIVLLPPVTIAEDCVPITENPEVDVLLPNTERYYVDSDICTIESCFSVWIYKESNGVDGLQRNDQFSGDRTCGKWPADTIVF